MEDEDNEFPRVEDYGSCSGDEPMSMSGCEERTAGDSPVIVVTLANQSYQQKKNKSLMNWIKIFDSLCTPYLEFKGLSQK
jgi:hypothetical protein